MSACWSAWATARHCRNRGCSVCGSAGLCRCHVQSVAAPCGARRCCRRRCAWAWRAARRAARWRPRARRCARPARSACSCPAPRARPGTCWAPPVRGRCRAGGVFARGALQTPARHRSRAGHFGAHPGLADTVESVLRVFLDPCGFLAACERAPSLPPARCSHSACSDASAATHCMHAGAAEARTQVRISAEAAAHGPPEAGRR